MMRLRLTRLAFTGALLFAGRVAAQSTPAVADTSAPARPVVALAGVEVDTASLRPGDVLRLKIWREPDLSGDFTVDERGQAVLPRLGATMVSGTPADQLKQRLTQEYQKYLNNPSIEVIPLRRISILGAVRNPGMYPVDPSITLGEAANVAGGAMPESKRNMLELRRNGTIRQVDLKKQPRLASLPLSSGDQVYVPEKSWFSKNATWVIGTAIGVAGTTALLLTRH
jgi:polysaccharide export outer membrane protein